MGESWVDLDAEAGTGAGDADAKGEGVPGIVIGANHATVRVGFGFGAPKSGERALAIGWGKSPDLEQGEAELPDVSREKGGLVSSSFPSAVYIWSEL
jgi:hypothetical protein